MKLWNSREEKAFQGRDNQRCQKLRTSRGRKDLRLSVGSCSHRKILVILVRLAWKSGRWIQKKKKEEGKTVRGDHCLTKVK